MIGASSAVAIYAVGNFRLFDLIALINKNIQTHIYNSLLFLAASFLIFILEESKFTDFHSLVGLLAVIQMSFILSCIGIFYFQKVAVMKK